jgi:hypothetical protein
MQLTEEVRSFVATNTAPFHSCTVLLLSRASYGSRMILSPTVLAIKIASPAIISQHFQYLPDTVLLLCFRLYPQLG